MTVHRRVKRMTGLTAFLLTACVCAQAAPGDRFILVPADLPPPHTTLPVDFDPEFVERPANAVPQVPPGFAISLFASGLHIPVPWRWRPTAMSMWYWKAPEKFCGCAT